MVFACRASLGPVATLRMLAGPSPRLRAFKAEGHGAFTGSLWCLPQEIRAIFGDDERAANGEEKRIGYTEFLGRINARLHKLRNAKKVVSYPKAHQTARQRQDRSRPA
eukprot:GHVT01091142.1.p4 GENE.GHVT01091142.1~~GHVT01091142.1.p4  ORF type:complete len:108 (+),score=27.48 GHVT01091142.1:1688-2011(+)